MPLSPEKKAEMQKVLDSKLTPEKRAEMDAILNPKPIKGLFDFSTPQAKRAIQSGIEDVGSMFTGIQQGATLGGMDEGQSALAAFVAKQFGGQPTKDISFEQLREDALNQKTQELKKINPEAAFAGSLAGGALGIGGAAGLKGLAQVAPKAAKWLVNSNTFLGARGKDLLQGFITGGVTGGLTNNEDRAAGAIGGAAIGGALSPVLGGALQYGMGKFVKPDVIEKYLVQEADNLKPIRLSKADLGDEEARSVFQLAKMGKLGKEAQEVASEFSEAQSKDFADNFVSLYRGEKTSNEALGDGLSKRLLDAGRLAREQSASAYTKAEPALKTAGVNRGNLIPLIDDLKRSISTYDIEINPTAKGVLNIANDLESFLSGASQKGVAIKPKLITLNTLEGIRRRINNLPANDAATASARNAAKSSFDNFSNDLLESGLVQGDKNALNLIKEARTKHAYYKQNFDSKDANRVIKSYIEAEGENLTPEMLLDKFIAVNQAGLDGIKSAKTILGDNVKPIFKEGILNKIYNLSTVKQQVLDDAGNMLKDANGQFIYKDIIVPEKLASSIEKFLGKDINFLKEAGFEPSDLKSLRQLQSIARQVSLPFDKSNPSGSGNKLIDFIRNRPLIAGMMKLPFIGESAKAISEKSSAQAVRGIIQNQPAQKTLLGGIEQIKPLKINIPK